MNAQKKLKPVKCRACGELFERFNSLQVACSVDCSIVVAAKKEADRERKAKRQAKRERIELKNKLRATDRQWWLKAAQTEFNKFIRWRDRGLPCISSGRTKATQWQAGHYRPSTVSALRFDEFNVNKQSSEDNTHRSGNLSEYRIGLIKKYGIEEVERLESVNEPYKWTIDELREIRDKYKAINKGNGV